MYFYIHRNNGILCINFYRWNVYCFNVVFGWKISSILRFSPFIKNACCFWKFQFSSIRLFKNLFLLRLINISILLVLQTFLFFDESLWVELVHFITCSPRIHKVFGCFYSSTALNKTIQRANFWSSNSSIGDSN